MKKYDSRFIKEINDYTIHHSKLFVGIVIISELLMLIYGLNIFDFSSKYSIVYIIQYIALIIASVAVLAFDIYLEKSKIKPKSFVTRTAILAYICCIMLWSVIISVLDNLTGGFCIVFLTVVFGVSGGIVLIPREAVSILSFFFLTYFAMDMTYGERAVGFGYFFNLLVFYAFAIAISFLKFDNYKHQFATKIKLAEQNGRLYNKNKQLSSTNEELERLSETDTLTGACSRWKMKSRFDVYIKSEHTPLTIAMIDIDDFKEINDTYGHMQGDKCLVCVTSIIMKHIPQRDVFRYGGEEFLVYLPQNKNMSHKILESIRHEIEVADLGDYNINLTVSIGLFTVYPGMDYTINECINNADTALYTSKHSGKNCITVYNH